MKVVLFIIGIVFSLMIGGCSSYCWLMGDELKDYESVPLASAVGFADEFNTRGYVIGVIVCPKGEECIRPDCVIFGQSAEADPAKGVEFSAICYDTFEVGAEYSISFKSDWGIVAAVRHPTHNKVQQ